MTMNKEIASKEFERYTLRLLDNGDDGFVLEQRWKSHGSSTRVVFKKDELKFVKQLLENIDI